MGGIAILIAFCGGSVFFLKQNYDGIAVVLVTLGFGIIGYIDDYIKVVKKRSLGLKPMQKIVGQLVITVLFAWYLYQSNLGTEIYIPLQKV